MVDSIRRLESEVKMREVDGVPSTEPTAPKIFAAPGANSANDTPVTAHRARRNDVGVRSIDRSTHKEPMTGSVHNSVALRDLALVILAHNARNGVQTIKKKEPLTWSILDANIQGASL